MQNALFQTNGLICNKADEHERAVSEFAESTFTGKSGCVTSIELSQRRVPMTTSARTNARGAGTMSLFYKGGIAPVNRIRRFGDQ
jgi:hypothetical protein